jgi:hypothetical protein
MTGLPVKLAGDSGAAMHQLLSGRIAVTCPIVGAFIRVPDRSAYSSRTVSPEALDKSNERCWIEPVTQMQRGYETRKSKNAEMSDSDKLLEPGVTVA